MLSIGAIAARWSDRRQPGERGWSGSFTDKSREKKRMAAERKPEFFAGKDLQIGIIGCGYVGFPLSVIWLNCR